MRPHQVLLPVLIIATLFTLSMAGCRTDSSVDDERVRVVATTSMLAEMSARVGGDRVAVTGLMGPGVDPHLYKASEGDVARMASADVVIYNGLHLEGKMTDIFERMNGRGIITVAVAEAIPEDSLLQSAYFAGNFDPHVWFDVMLWKRVLGRVVETLALADPEGADGFRERGAAYGAEMEEADAYVRSRVEQIPLDMRVLVTSHDAFGYFGRAYGFEVRGLQGISTATEAGTADVQQLARFVAERKIPALFIETSVSPRGIEAVLAAVRARGTEVELGGTLYGDALGSPGTPAATYNGMIRANIDTIVDALAGGTGTRP